MDVATPVLMNRNGSNNRKSLSLFPSPKPRKSLNHFISKTPVLNGEKSREKSIPSGVFIAGQQNNDEEELRERQRQRAAELQQQNLNSPSTPADRRKSMGPATGMTNAALADHYSNCIKLSAENKINIKNAFNLQLIDCMSEMLRIKDPEMNNFQAASCTLDASTKIYAYRVDCVHNDTLKMAGGLGRSGAEGDKSNEEEAPNAGDDEEANQVKKRNRKKNKKTIETNIDNLNLSKFELEYDVDPLFKKSAAMFDEGRNGGVNFLNTINMKDDSCQLALDSDALYYSASMKSVFQNSKSVPVPYQDLSTADICPSLKGFSFTDWNPEEDDLLGSMNSPSKRKLDDYKVPELLPSNEDHAFDMDAAPDPIYGSDDLDNDTYVGMEDIDEEEGQDRLKNATSAASCQFPVLAKQAGALDLRDHISDLPLEYSYFGTTTRCAWAGPLHWKFKQGSKLAQEYKENQEPKKKRRKEPLQIDFENPPDFGHSFDPGRNTTKLTNNTLIQWLPEKITLPEDVHYDIKELTQLFLRPLIHIRQMKSDQSSQVVEEVVSPYDYSNKRDAENFCPDVNGDSDMDDNVECGATFNAFDDVSQFEQSKLLSQFSGENLIAAPNMVAKIQINYARVAKKMDMRRLKSTMWTMLSESYTDFKEGKKPEDSVSFSSSYKEIPSRLPQKMADNLSVSLAFAALLHLANENSLILQQEYGNLNDFFIVPPS